MSVRTCIGTATLFNDISFENDSILNEHLSLFDKSTMTSSTYQPIRQSIDASSQRWPSIPIVRLPPPRFVMQQPMSINVASYSSSRSSSSFSSSMSNMSIDDTMPTIVHYTKSDRSTKKRLKRMVDSRTHTSSCSRSIRTNVIAIIDSTTNELVNRDDYVASQHMRNSIIDYDRVRSSKCNHGFIQMQQQCRASSMHNDLK